MRRKVAAIAALPLMIVLAAPAQAVPNYAVFLQAIAGDGIVMDSQQAIVQGHTVCTIMRPPDGGSLWDAAQHINSMHSDWRMDASLHFANRAVQDICPDRESFQ